MGGVKATAAGREGEREVVAERAPGPERFVMSAETQHELLADGFHLIGEERTCRCCGWTDDLGCEDDADWPQEDLCSECAAENALLAGPGEGEL